MINLNQNERGTVMDDSKIISMQGVNKKYAYGRGNVLHVLHDINLDIEEGSFASIVGASGSGKSTLMNIIGLLDNQLTGKYILGGKDISAFSDKERSRTRNSQIGFVFQTFNLLPKLNAVKNVELPMLYAKKAPNIAMSVL